MVNGQSAREGSWASGPTPDGNAEFSYHDGPTTRAPLPPPPAPDPRPYGTTRDPNVVQKIKAKIKDVTGH